MNLKKFGLKVLSAAIAMVMIMSVCAPAIVAAAAEDDTPKYVSLGASNVNGYGLRGYIPVDMDAAALDANLKQQANVFGCGVETPGSYPVLVAEALGADLTQLAMSSMRAEELRFLLDDTYTGDAYTDWRFCDTANYPEKNSANWFVGAGRLLAGDNTLEPEKAVAALRKAYKDAITEADYITVDIGVNNFGVYVSGKLSDPTLNWENDLSLIDPALAANYEEGKAYVKGLIAQYAPEIDATLADMPLDMDDFVDTLAYALVGFCTNFDVIMEKIHELNPDATVVAVSIQNLMAGLELALPGMDPAPFGEIFGALINAANIYMAVGSPYADQYYCADVRKNGGRVEFFSDDIAKYDGDPKTLSDNIIDCFDVLDGFDDPYDKGIHVKYQLHKFLNSEWESLAGAQVAGVYTTFESFMAAGAEGFAELAETSYASFIPTLQGMYAEFSVKYDAMLYAAYDVVASIFQAGAKTTVLDLGGLAFMGDIEDVLADSIFAEMETAVVAAMNDATYDYKLSETFFADIAAAANAAAGAELVTEAHIATVAAFAVRTSVGNSFFGHPNPEGHKTIATKILETIANKTTGKDIAKDELEKILKELEGFVKEYYDDAYAYGYGYAVENGYVDTAVAALDNAIAAIAALEVENEYIDAELKAALEAELSEVVKTLGELKAALTENKAATVDGLVETVKALENDLNAHLANVEKILTLAGADAYEYLYPVVMKELEKLETEVIPEIIKTAEAMAEKAYEHLLRKVAEIMGIIVDANAKAEEIAESIRQYVADVYGIVLDVNATIEEMIETIRQCVEDTKTAISEYIAKITAGEYTVSDDSYYVAIDGEGYASALAEALNLSAEQYKAVAMNEVTFEDIAKADLITVSYDNGSVVAFTSEQLLGYAKAYLDGALRADANAYVESAFSDILSADGFAKINGAIDAAIDSVVASDLLADKEAVALDWAALVGEEKVAKVDEARAAIVKALTEAGVPADYEIEIDVVKALYENAETLGLSDVLANFNQNWFYEELGANAVYTVKVPVLDLAVFAAESALYEAVRYNAEYSQTILAINKINPEATVAVLGSYDLLGGVAMDLGEIAVNETVNVTELLMLEEIPGMIEAIVDELPAGEELVLELGELENYKVDIPVAELAALVAEKFNVLAGYVEAIEIPVTNETVGLILDYAKNNFSVEAEYNAFVADVNAKLAEVASVGVYTVEIPVVAIVDYAAAEYDKLVELFALLAEVDYTVDDVVINETVDLNKAYDTVVGLTSVHPLAYAVMFENVFFVAVDDVETNFAAAVAAGVAESDALSFVLAYVENAAVAEPSAAGNAYIVEQILAALTVTCEHVYDDECTDVDCNRCGEIREVKGHIFTNYVSDNNATCAKDGTKTATCDVCGEAKDTVEDEGSSATVAHTFTEYVSNNDATCVKEGTKTAVCDVCENAKDTIADPDAEGTHTFTNYVSNGDATCTADGTKTATCDVCGEAKDTVADTGSKLAHSFTVVVGFREGNCYTIQSTTFKCTGCSATQTVLGTKGAHVPGEAATCKAAQTCTICNEELAPKAEHTPGAAATCKAAQTCTVCNEELAPKAEHTPGAAATCTTAQTCTVCNAELAKALGHKAGAAATCTTAQTCTVCKAEIAKATGHSFAPATCKAPKTCTVCKVTEGEVADHTYENACDADCEVCGAERTVEHTYGEWTLTKEPTKEADGEQQRVCSKCETIETEVIPAGTEIQIPGGDTTSISVGGIVGIVFAVLAVIGGGVAVVLVVMKKKII